MVAKLSRDTSSLAVGLFFRALALFALEAITLKRIKKKIHTKASKTGIKNKIRAAFPKEEIFFFTGITSEDTTSSLTSLVLLFFLARLELLDELSEAVPMYLSSFSSSSVSSGAAAEVSK